MTVGPLLKRLRQKKGWTQKELSQRAGVRPALLSRLESGKQLDTQGHVLQRLARTLDVTVDELLAGEIAEEVLLIP